MRLTPVCRLSLALEATLLRGANIPTTSISEGGLGFVNGKMGWIWQVPYGAHDRRDGLPWKSQDGRRTSGLPRGERTLCKDAFRGAI